MSGKKKADAKMSNREKNPKKRVKVTRVIEFVPGPKGNLRPKGRWEREVIND